MKKVVLFLTFLFVIINGYSQVHINVDFRGLKYGRIDSIWVNGDVVSNSEKLVAFFDLEDDFFTLKIKTSRGCFEVTFLNEIFRASCEEYYLNFKRAGRKARSYHLSMWNGHALNGVLNECSVNSDL